MHGWQHSHQMNIKTLRIIEYKTNHAWTDDTPALQVLTFRDMIIAGHPNQANMPRVYALDGLWIPFTDHMTIGGDGRHFGMRGMRKFGASYENAPVRLP